MQVESSLKSTSPQGRLAVYHNRTVGALWLMVLIGVFTILEPFLLFGSKVIFIPGLIAPEVIVTLIKQYQGSQVHTVMAVMLGLLVILLGIMGMKGKVGAFKAGALLLGIDMLLLAAGVSISKPDSQEVFMIVVTIAVRLYFLRIIIRGVRAVGFKRQQQEEMKEADREYEKQRRKGIRYSLDDDRSDDFDSEDYEEKGLSMEKQGQQGIAKNAAAAYESKYPKYCANCGAPVEEDNRYCEQCGHEVEV